MKVTHENVGKLMRKFEEQWELEVNRDCYLEGGRLGWLEQRLFERWPTRGGEKRTRSS